MTKERLHRYLDLKKERDDIKAKIQEIDDNLQAPRLAELTGMPRSGGGGGDYCEALLDRKAELLKLYYSKLVQIDAEMIAVERAIESLDPTERRLLRYRYIDGLKWEEICVRLSYSWMHVHRLHAKALDELKDKALE